MDSQEMLEVQSQILRSLEKARMDLKSSKMTAAQEFEKANQSADAILKEALDKASSNRETLTRSLILDFEKSKEKLQTQLSTDLSSIDSFYSEFIKIFRDRFPNDSLLLEIIDKKIEPSHNFPHEKDFAYQIRQRRNKIEENRDAMASLNDNKSALKALTVIRSGRIVIIFAIAAIVIFGIWASYKQKPTNSISTTTAPTAEITKNPLPIATSNRRKQNVRVSTISLSEVKSIPSLWAKINYVYNDTSPTHRDYRIRINSAEVYRWSLGQCAISLSYLEDIWSATSFYFEIDGNPISRSYFQTSDYTFINSDGKQICRRLSVKLDQWVSGGAIKLFAAYSYARNIYDGKETFAKGKYERMIYVEVN